MAELPNKIYDPLHGFIYFDEIERDIIDSFAFQRLRHIQQLGMVYLVYPGGTHTRFAHSLGVMDLASRMYKRVCQSIRSDLFHDVPRKGSIDYIYYEKVLRIAALCHDLGHLPFSHVGEANLIGHKGHENWTLKIIESFAPVFAEFKKDPHYYREESDFLQDVIKIAVGEETLKKSRPNISFTSWEKILSEIIGGDFFGADRIDYLMRDSKSTGVMYGLFDYMQLIDTLRILPSEKGALTLGIDENGLESCEALLLARLFMHKRVYQHPTNRAFSYHLRRFLECVYKEKPYFKDVDSFLSLTDAHIVVELYNAAKDTNHKGNFDALRILKRRDHFIAIPLPASIKEEDLKSIQKKIPIDWELLDSTDFKKDFSFPVSKALGVIKSAKECSTLLSTIPTTAQRWVYIAPEYAPLLSQKLLKLSI